ncbi:hypothetical protein A6C57_23310 [Fibrella sp. ES10-3-2-2]|nr:hypothetical protein A6C57_23310 [Fibrella sp. ES10-3-2-2]
MSQTLIVYARYRGELTYVTSYQNCTLKEAMVQNAKASGQRHFDMKRMWGNYLITGISRKCWGNRFDQPRHILRRIERERQKMQSANMTKTGQLLLF